MFQKWNFVGCFFDDNQISFQAVPTSHPHLEKGHIFTSKTPEKHLHNKRVSRPKYFNVTQTRFHSALMKTKIWQLNRCWNVLVSGWWQSQSPSEVMKLNLLISVSDTSSWTLLLKCLAVMGRNCWVRASSRTITGHVEILLKVPGYPPRPAVRFCRGCSIPHLPRRSRSLWTAQGYVAGF